MSEFTEGKGRPELLQELIDLIDESSLKITQGVYDLEGESQMVDIADKIGDDVSEEMSDQVHKIIGGLELSVDHVATQLHEAQEALGKINFKTKKETEVSA